MNVNERINKLFDELVPSEGSADTVAGEIIRALCMIHRRNYNDGDYIDVGYGKETCNPPARYLMSKTSDKAVDILWDMWGVDDELYYIDKLNELKEEVVAYLDQHTELKETPNNEDMWNYCRPSDKDY